MKSTVLKTGTERDPWTLLLGLVLFLPALISFVLLYQLRLPFPYQDDFKAILEFAVRYVDAPSAASKVLAILLTDCGDYYLIFQHLVVACEIEITRHLNFGFLTAAGNLFLVGIAFQLWCCFKEQPLKARIISFLPVSFLFFGLTYWDTVNWAMGALQNLTVIFFALLALQCLANVPARVANYQFPIACAAACLSCCSSPNGFLLAPVGVFVLVARRYYVRSFVWLFSFALPLWVYKHPVKKAPIQYAFHLKQAFYFVAFFGGIFTQRFIAFGLGAVLLLTLGWAVRSRIVERNAVLFPLALWVVLTGALVESVRSALATRYSLYSALLILCCYKFILDALPERFPIRKGLLGFALTRSRFNLIAIGVSLVLFIKADVMAFHRLQWRRDMVVSGLKFYRLNPSVNSPQVNPLVDKAFPEETPFELEMLKQTAARNLYTVPSEQQLQGY